MNIKWHLRAYLASMFIGLFVGFFGMGFPIVVYFGTLPQWQQFVVMAGCAFFLMMGIRLLFFKIIPADCPICKDKVRLAANRFGELSYKCSSCKFSYNTGVTEDGGD